MLGMIVAAAIESFGAALRRALLRQKLLAAAAVIALIALVYFTIAGDLWLIPWFGAAGAAALTGVILLVLAAVLVVIAGSLRPTRTTPVSTLALGEAMDLELRALAKPLTIAALIAGFIFAQRQGRDAPKD